MKTLLCGLAILLLTTTGASADETIDRPFPIVFAAIIASTVFDAHRRGCQRALVLLKKSRGGMG